MYSHMVPLPQALAPPDFSELRGSICPRAWRAAEGTGGSNLEEGGVISFWDTL